MKKIYNWFLFTLANNKTFLWFVLITLLFCSFIRNESLTIVVAVFVFYIIETIRIEHKKELNQPCGSAQLPPNSNFLLNFF